MINGTPGDDLLLNNVGEDDVIDGQGGTDTVSYASAGGAGGGVVVGLDAGYAFDLTNFDFDYPLTSIENVTGSAFGDTLVGDAGANILDGGAGVDQLYGGNGNDTLNGDDDGDSLFGQDGVDLLHGGNADDFLDGGQGNDTLFGDAGDDSLLGDSGDDTLVGGAGNDALNGGLGSDVFKYSFTLAEAPGEAKTLTFTDWLSEKYCKDFGDELPDFERGHDHYHHGKHDDHHGKNDHHHQHYAHHHDHHHNHNGCGDHQPQHWGLSQSFFAQNYSEWLREVVVPDLQAQGLAHDMNGDGKIDVSLNQKDPDGTPRIEGLSDEQLSAIFGDRDEVALRQHHHGHDAWYSNSYTSPGGAGETTVASDDGFDTIVDFAFGEDKLVFSGLGDLTLEQFTNLFKVSDVDTDGLSGADSTMLVFADSTPADIDWGITVQGAGHTIDEFYASTIFS